MFRNKLGEGDQEADLQSHLTVVSRPAKLNIRQLPFKDGNGDGQEELSIPENKIFNPVQAERDDVRENYSHNDELDGLDASP